MSSEERVRPHHQDAREDVPLRRNWSFQLLWVGAGSAFLGMDAADIAYPLVILGITGSPAIAGLFGLIQTAVMLVLGLPAGLVADRVDLKRLLIAAELTRAVAAGSVALALALDALRWQHLLVVSAVLGAAATFAGPSRMLLVRSVVPRDQLTQALTQEEVRSGVTGLVGRPIGGALYTVRQALPFFLCFLTFVISAVCALFVRVPAGRRPQRPDRDQGWSSAFAGVRELVTSASLRAALLLVTLSNLLSVALVLIVVVSLRNQDYSGTAIGLAMSGGAVGTILGSILVRHVHRLLTPGWLLVTSGCVAAICTLALGPGWGPAWVFAVLVVFSLTGPSMRVLVDILIFRQVPEERRGRTISATMTAVGIGLPVGSLMAGLLLQYADVAVAVGVLAAMMAAATAFIASNRGLTRMPWPTPEPAGPASGSRP